MDHNRPNDWNDYVGQERLKTRLQSFIDVANEVPEPLVHTLLVGPPGMGKGHPYGTQILVPGGWTRIEDLVVGDSVIGSNGTPITVTGVFDRGTLPIYTVAFSDHCTIQVDGDHLWSVRDSHNRESVRSTTELIEQGVKKDGRSRWHIPLVEPVQHPKEDLPVDPYLLGVLIANGHLSGTPCIRTNDVEIIDRIRHSDPSITIVESTSELSTARGWNVHNMRDKLRTLDLYDHRSADKFIPFEYLVADVWSRRELLKGLMDCDGHALKEKDGAEYYTSSQHLAEDVKTLVESLGGVGQIRSYDYANRQGVEYRVGVRLAENPFILKRKHDTWTQPNTTNRRIESIVDGGTGEVRCISVDAEDNLYVTEHHIVTHNTTLALLTAQALDEDLKMFVMPVTPSVMEAIVKNHQGILFCDEIHRLPVKQQEDLLPLLEDGFLQSKTGVKYHNEWLTIIGATTEPESIIPPLYDRFTFKPMFDPYTPAEMQEMVSKMAERRDIELPEEIIAGIAEAAAGIPRNARHLVDAARTKVLVGEEVSLSDVLAINGVTKDGLTDMHVEYLKVMNSLGGKTGLSNLCTLLRLHPKVVQDLERLLIEKELITFTTSGRELTMEGIKVVQPPVKKRVKNGDV